MNDPLFWLCQDNYRTYNIEVARKLGSIQCAIILSELASKHRHLQKKGELYCDEKNGDGWFYFTHEALTERTFLTRREQDSALSTLISSGLIEKKIIGLPAVRYFKLNINNILELFKTDSNNVYILYENAKLDCTKTPNQFGGIVQTGHIEKEQQYINNNNTYPTLSNAGAANAARVCSDISSNSQKAKTKSPTKTRLEKVSQEAKDFLPKFVEVIQRTKPNYVVKEELNMLESIDQMLREKRTPEEILEVLDWAIKDNTIRGNWNGWSSKVMCRNPAAYLCNKFDQIQISSKAKKERKFSPSSNDEEALKKIQSMKKYAI